jgi:hypothetical protein
VSEIAIWALEQMLNPNGDILSLKDGTQTFGSTHMEILESFTECLLRQNCGSSVEPRFREDIRTEPPHSLKPCLIRSLKSLGVIESSRMA